MVRQKIMAIMAIPSVCWIFDIVDTGEYSFLLDSVGHINLPVIIFLAFLVIGGSLVIIWLPNWFIRLFLWTLSHTLYDLKVIGKDNIPRKGGALFVSNHTSFVDVLMLLAASPRPVRFMMFKDIYERPLMKLFARRMHSIPVSSELRPRDMIQSLRITSYAMRKGGTVCISAA